MAQKAPDGRNSPGLRAERIQYFLAEIAKRQAQSRKNFATGLSSSDKVFSAFF